MLVTSSQVSVVLSCGIIVIFTLLLFLTGYTLQRQTTDALSASIKPRMRLLASQIQAGIDLELDTEVGPQYNGDARAQKALRRSETETQRSAYAAAAEYQPDSADEEDLIMSEMSEVQILSDLARSRARERDWNRYLQEDGEEGSPSGRPKRIKLEAPTGLDRIAGGKRWVKAEDGWRVVDGDVGEVD